MTKNQFSKPEQFLIKNWADVLQLRQSTDSISDTYDAICGEVVAAVREKMPELNHSRVFDEFRESGRQIALGRKRWPSKWTGWLSGFYISDIGLESLSSESEDPPTASIWLIPPSGSGLDHAQARNRIRREAKQRLRPEQLKACCEDEDPCTCLCFSLPERRDRLLEMLLNDRTQDYVDCMVSHFEVLAKFIPVVDELLLSPTKSKR